MKNEDLLLLLNNSELTKTIINLLSKNNKPSVADEMPILNKEIHGETNIFGEPIGKVVPLVNDLRDNGYQAPSKFVREFVFPIGRKFVVWYQGHESSLRNAFYRKDIQVSIDTLSKGKKLQITILGPKMAKKKLA